MKKILLSLLLGLNISVASAAEPVRVLMETSMGNITLELNAEKAPVTVANFVSYVKAKHYDGLTFHRVISGFMIQGGGFDQEYNERETQKPIINEAKNGLKNVRGSIAMARTGDPNSATSQFFINHGNNSSLDYPRPDRYGYAVFGKVTDGMDVVDKIAAVEVKTLPHVGENVPVTPVIIRRVTILTAKM